MNYPRHPMDYNLVVLVLGGTGDLGQHVIRQLSNNPRVSEIIMVSRRLIELVGLNKVSQRVVDFENLDDHQSAFKGADVAICCMGSKCCKVKKEEFTKVNYDYVINSARILKEGGSCQQFHLVSKWGANPDCCCIHSKVKGRAEEVIKAFGFPRASIYRPGMLIRTTEECKMKGMIVNGIAKCLDKTSKYSVPSEVFAKALIYNATNRMIEGKLEIIEHAEIIKMAQEGDCHSMKENGPKPKLIN